MIPNIFGSPSNTAESEYSERYFKNRNFFPLDRHIYYPVTKIIFTKGIKLPFIVNVPGILRVIPLVFLSRFYL